MNDAANRARLVAALREHQAAFGVKLSDDQAARLADYYDLVQDHNPTLHLVAPCSPEEFAVRHVLESLTLLEFLPAHSRFADVGAGAGLPSVPCLIVRRDLRTFLIESKAKKIGFLQSILTKFGLIERATLIHSQFAETPRPDVSHVTCRALDRFAQNLPRLLKWSGGRTLLFFGGPSLREQFIGLGVGITEKLLPMSQRRYLFVTQDRKPPS